jgi:hypothetical protein
MTHDTQEFPAEAESDPSAVAEEAAEIVAEVVAEESDEERDLDDAPSVLYHYTSSAGLQGILNSRSVWATDIEFLNDEQELRHGLDQFLTSFKDQVNKRYGSDRYERLAASFQVHEHIRHFVSSFCENGDLLSQWRGYASPGGYAIGFDARKLQPQLKSRRKGGGFMRVTYDPDTTAVMAKVWAGKVAERLEESFSEKLVPAGQSDVEAVARHLRKFHKRHFLLGVELCCLLKNPSFKEEQEWRVVRAIHMTPSRETNVNFREGPLGLTPYTSIDFTDESGRLPISEIVVGPGSSMELRVSAVRLLLAKLGYSRDVVVRASTIPYRP